MNCECDITEMRRKINSAGISMLGLQCQKCGQLKGGWISHAKLSGAAGHLYKTVEEVPLWNTELVEYLEAKSKIEWEQKREDTRNKQGEWFDSYNQYLKTPEWQKLRSKILMRDGCQCQGCLSATATHVHHVTYINVGVEFAFQLISLCESCHKRIHERKDGLP